MTEKQQPDKPEWDGVCVCGKTEKDGRRCRFGATHKPLEKTQ